MKGEFTTFMEGLIALDYLLFASVFIFFILFIIFGILLRKRVLLALLFILLAFSILLVAPTLGYIKMHEYLFKNTLTLTSQKRLTFTEAIVLKGTLKNESKRDFSSCKIKASVYAVTSSELKNYFKKLKPFQNASIVIEDIGIGQTKEFKMFIEPFTYSRDYNISLGADCR